MSALVNRTRQPSVAPPLSPALAGELGRLTASRAAPLLEEARRWQAAYEAAWAEAPGAALIEAWLLPVSLQVANRPSAEDIRIRVGGLLDVAASGRLPAFAFGEETRRLAIAEFRFWPSAAEIVTLLEAWLARHEDRAYAVGAFLKRALEPWPAPAVESAVPYAIPPAPEWVAARDTRHLPAQRVSLARPPERTVAEQLAALGYPDGVVPKARSSRDVPVRPVQSVPVKPAEEVADD